MRIVNVKSTTSMVLLRLFFAALFLIPVFGGLTGLPASAETARPTGDPTKVHVSIFILDVDGINNADQNFDANVFFLFRWALWLFPMVFAVVVVITVGL
ncbi:MAG: hypothetical protein KAH56_14655 [Candidatus Krumholzibacteria bacterium]|nr:hypothetical protein [Candidatus Krumholzibacteria bacterium]